MYWQKKFPHCRGNCDDNPELPRAVRYARVGEAITAAWAWRRPKKYRQRKKMPAAERLKTESIAEALQNKWSRQLDDNAGGGCGATEGGQPPRCPSGVGIRQICSRCLATLTSAHRDIAERRIGLAA